LLKDVFGKHAPKPILTFFVLEKNGFCETWLKKNDLCLLHTSNPYKRLHFIYKKMKKKKVFNIVLEKLCFVFHFLGIYNKFVKFLKDLTNISITLIFFSLKINVNIMV